MSSDVVFAFDLGGVREWLVDRKTGCLVPKKLDLNDAFRVISQQHKILLPAWRENCFSIAKEKFSEENFVKEFRNLAEVLK